ncbi:hypothetical protein HK096_006638 [Nowakowskiella sp. JEL0078]|nr:hypothetical protein HK096_006638 [Nowakowskiella sp. JEL0078]
MYLENDLKMSQLQDQEVREKFVAALKNINERTNFKAKLETALIDKNLCQQKVEKIDCKLTESNKSILVLSLKNKNLYKEIDEYRQENAKLQVEINELKIVIEDFQERMVGVNELYAMTILENERYQQELHEIEMLMGQIFVNKEQRKRVSFLLKDEEIALGFTETSLFELNNLRKEVTELKLKNEKSSQKQKHLIEFLSKFAKIRDHQLLLETTARKKSDDLSAKHISELQKLIQNLPALIVKSYGNI